jgi:hypothetical protein
MGWKIWTANSSRSSSPKHQDWLWNQTAFNSMGGSRVLSQMSVSHLHLPLRLTMSTATSLPSYRPHGADTDNFTVYSMASQLPRSPLYHRSLSSQRSSLFHYTRLSGCTLHEISFSPNNLMHFLLSKKFILQ